MKFLTKALEKDFEKMGRQDYNKDPIVIVKYFPPVGSQSYYMINYYPESQEFYGYITGSYVDEFGYFSIPEMKSIRVKPFNLPLERDMHFKQDRLSVVLQRERHPMPRNWKKYINYDIPENIDVEKLLEVLATEIKLYSIAYQLTKNELRDLDEDSVNQAIYDDICDSIGIESKDDRELATDVMRYHFWDTLDKVNGGLYD